MKTKIEKIGWMGKAAKLNKEILGEGCDMEFCIDSIYTNKGCEDEWTSDDWPPKKVKITIEEI